MRKVPFLERGIYGIVCDPTERLYIGQAAFAVWDRWRSHIQHLRRGTHFCSQWQSDWDWYGEAEFSFALIEQLPWSATVYQDLREAEQRWIAFYRPLQPLYNKHRKSKEETP